MIMICNIKIVREMKCIKLFLCISAILINIQLFSQSEAQLVESCVSSTGSDVTYLKDFVVKLEGTPAGHKEKEFVTAMVLSKNTEYKFSICTAESSVGEGIIKLVENNVLLGSTFNPATGKMYKGFNFKCQKTGVYHLKISFQDGKPGYAVGILSFVKML